MADVQQAVDAVLHQEDSTLSGVITNVAHDTGGTTRFGLCASTHPALLQSGFYDATRVPRDQALAIARETYATEFGKPLCLEQIKDQGVALALLSFAVNDGQHQAVKLMQRAVNSCGGSLGVDGCMGSNTVNAINAVDPKALVSQLCQTQDAFYQELATQDPTQQKFLNGWRNRVTTVLNICQNLPPMPTQDAGPGTTAA